LGAAVVIVATPGIDMALGIALWTNRRRPRARGVLHEPASAVRVVAGAAAAARRPRSRRVPARPRVRAALDRVSGLVLVALGVRLAAARR
jgi:threonine/homoserine/homoserine lactone efflux protein